MKKISKLISLVTVTLVLMSLIVFSVCAADSANFDKLLKKDGPVMSIAYRGNAAQYPSNSMEAVLSGADSGADMISVSVAKTKDNVLVLCENKALNMICDTEQSDISLLTYDDAKNFKLYSADGSVSDYTIPKLEDVIEKLDGKSVLVIDNAWNFRDDVYALCQRLNALKSIMLRTDVSSKQIAQWVNGKGENAMLVIGVYDGNIVFNAVSHLERLTKAGQPAVQYQSKNYFNVMYDHFTAKKYSSNGNARAIAPMYDKDLCGQRSDTIQGWDEMIERGFSVIETNNADGLKAYILQCEKSKNQLASLIESAEKVNVELYSQVSVKNFNTALNHAKKTAERQNSSLGEIQECISGLTSAMNNLTFSGGADSQKGNLNITAGKIAAVIIFGALILAGEIYVHKMHKPQKRQKH